MKKRSVLTLLPVAALLVGLLGGCGNDLAPVYVQRVSTVAGYGSANTTCAGIVVAQNEVKIEKETERKVEELKVEAGQSVSQGDVLFVYDTAQMQLNIDKAELELEQKKNAIKDFDTQIAQLEKDKAAAPESEQLSYTVQIQSLQTDKKEAEYNITVMERDLDALKAEDLSGEIKSPIDGMVKSVNVSDSYDPYTGMPLPYITLIQSGAYRVKGTLNELNIGEFSIGQRVVLHSRVDDALTWSGSITEIETAPQEDNGNDKMYYYGYDSAGEMSSSSGYPFYIELDSIDGLMLGQHVYITADNGQNVQKDGIWLDESYVVTEGSETYVWAADDDDELEKRKVGVGEYDETGCRYLITSGLALSDRIAFPTDELQEGAPVTETKPADETEPAPGGDEPSNDVPIEEGGEVYIPEEGGEVNIPEEGGEPVDEGVIAGDFVPDEGFVDEGDTAESGGVG